MTLYPLVILLGVAAWRQFYAIIPFVLPLVVIGVALSIYQVLIQEIPSWGSMHLCGFEGDCTEKIKVGFATLSMGALLCFVLLLALLIWTWKSREPNS